MTGANAIAGRFELPWHSCSRRAPPMTSASWLRPDIEVDADGLG
jgi:hypothetical protein